MNYLSLKKCIANILCRDKKANRNFDLRLFSNFFETHNNTREKAVSVWLRYPTENSVYLARCHIYHTPEAVDHTLNSL